MKSVPPKRWSSPAAFSLIELLAVMAIILAVIGTTLPSLQSMLSSNRLAQAGERIVGALSVARQVAMSQNREVEVRFITCQSPENASLENELRAIQVLTRADDGTWRSITKPTMFATAVVGWKNSNESTLSKITSSTPVITGPAADPRVGGVGHDYTYQAFRFRADGSTDLPMMPTLQEVDGQVIDKLFLTIVDERHANDSNLPPNYVSIAIQPRTGAVTAWRP